MNYILNHLKCIANFLIASMLFQSCVIYQKTPTPFEDIPEHTNTHILIETVQGEKYRLRWIEERGDDMYSIVNTERYFIDTVIIQSICKDNIPLKNISFRMIQHRLGTYTVTATNQKYKFIIIDVEGHYLVGYKKVGGKNHPITIPKNQIDSVRLIDNWASVRVTRGIAFGFSLAGLFGLGILTYGIVQSFQDFKP